MATIEEIKESAIAAVAGVADAITGIADIAATLEEQDTKLDEIKVFIAGLAGAPITQAQLDEIGALLTDIKARALEAKDKAVLAKDKASAVLAEADALDAVEPPPPAA